MQKKTLRNEEARKEMMVGADAVCDDVGISLGPKGSNKAFRNAYGEIEASNDGKKIADSVKLDDPIQQIGVEIAQGLANKSNETAKDLRSTCLVMWQYMIHEGNKYLMAGISRTELYKGIKMAGARAVEIIKTKARKVENDDDIKHVASVAADSKELGEVIAKVIKKIGADGEVTTESLNGNGIEDDIAEGISFDRGYLQEWMINKKDRGEAVHEGVDVLVTEKKISSLADILNITKILVAEKKEKFVIIAEDVTDIALDLIALNQVRNGIETLIIKAPDFGDRKKAWLADIAVTVGANLIKENGGKLLSEVTMSDLGLAHSVVSTRNKTTIIGNNNEGKEIAEHVQNLEVQKENETDPFKIEMLSKRINRLKNGVAIIRVGGTSEREVNFLRDKIKDGVAAAQGAMSTGVVLGGGATLIHVAKQMEDELSKNTELSREMRMGFEIVINSLRAPLARIAKNGGHDEISLITYQIENKGGNAGFDAMKDEVVDDMFEAGIVDANKSLCLAVEHASGDAALFLTIDVASDYIRKD